MKRVQHKKQRLRAGFPKMVDIMNIDISMDSVVVNGVTLYRPDRISRSAWLSFWERTKDLAS